MKRNKIAFVAVITILVLYYPIGLLHEFGHYLVGLNSHSTCVIHWWLAGECYPLPQPFMLYWALGGIFGMIGSFSLVALKKVHSNKGILIGVLMLGVSHFVNFVFETFAHFAYLNNAIAGILMASSEALAFIALWKFFSKTASKKT